MRENAYDQLLRVDLHSSIADRESRDWEPYHRVRREGMDIQREDQRNQSNPWKEEHTHFLLITR